MRILFTGGGSGGHFYPIIAIAQEVLLRAREQHLIPPRLFFMAPEPYDEGLLFENSITFLRVPAGKLRRYASFRNITDIFSTAWGICKALIVMFRIYPDVVVGKGGFGSFPALFAARFWKIPTIIHESDAVPGRTNAWSGKFADRIAVSFPEAGRAFREDRVAYTGNPMRREMISPAQLDRGEFHLEENTKVIFVTGGSLGSAAINEVVLELLPVLLNDYEVIHQTGRENCADITGRAKILLEGHLKWTRYHPFGYLSTSQIAAAGGLTDIVISRAGSTIFEIAAWGKPSILVPISDSNGDHQRANAYAYARSGAAVVLEEENLSPTILLHEIKNILEDSARRVAMSEKARTFAKTDAAEVIAREILALALKHER